METGTRKRFHKNRNVFRNGNNAGGINGRYCAKFDRFRGNEIKKNTGMKTFG